MQAVIPAATHVDGTARVQSVRRHPDPDLHELLVQFDALTGVPAVVHTGFSPPGEPMVHRPGEAVAEYLRSDMDSLVLGPYVVDKPAA
jgi:carbamoyltransferase